VEVEAFFQVAGRGLESGSVHRFISPPAALAPSPLRPLPQRPTAQNKNSATLCSTPQRAARHTWSIVMGTWDVCTAIGQQPPASQPSQTQNGSQVEIKPREREPQRLSGARSGDAPVNRGGQLHMAGILRRLQLRIQRAGKQNIQPCHGNKFCASEKEPCAKKHPSARTAALKMAPDRAGRRRQTETPARR